MNESIRRHLAACPKGIEVLNDREPVEFDLLVWRQEGLIPQNHVRVVAQFDPANAPANEAELVMRLQAAATAWIRTEDGRAVAEYAGGSPNFGDIISHGPSALTPHIDGCLSFSVEGQSISMEMTYDTEFGEAED
jgi:hypothetical protein